MTQITMEVADETVTLLKEVHRLRQHQLRISAGEYETLNDEIKAQVRALAQHCNAERYQGLTILETQKHFTERHVLIACFDEITKAGEDARWQLWQDLQANILAA